MTTPIIRTSERRDFLLCEWRWWKVWRQGLRSRSATSTALWFGTGVHFALACWYTGPGKKRGVPPAETWMKWSAAEIHNMKLEKPADGDVLEAELVDARELGRILLEEYVKHYGRDEHKLYIEPERTFEIDVPWPDGRQAIYEAVEGILARYVGTWDGVWRHADTGKVWLDETKTAKQIILSHLPLDPQAGSYWAIAIPALRADGLIGPKEMIAGIEYNFIRKGLPDERPKDAEGYACNKPVKADYAKAIEAERRTIPGKLPGTSWIGPPLTGKESLADLQMIADKLELTVLGERSKIQPSPLFVRHQVHRTARERRSQLLRIQNDAVRMQVLRDRYLPLTKNPTRDCPRCPVYNLCLLDEQSGNTGDFQRQAYRVADPYADHRKSASEH